MELGLPKSILPFPFDDSDAESLVIDDVADVQVVVPLHHCTTVELKIQAGDLQLTRYDTIFKVRSFDVIPHVDVGGARPEYAVLENLAEYFKLKSRYFGDGQRCWIHLMK